MGSYPDTDDDCTLQEKNTPEKTLWQRKTRQPSAGITNVLKNHGCDKETYPLPNSDQNG
jgi:hypothetical protein